MSLQFSTQEIPAVYLMVLISGYSGSPTFPGMQAFFIGLSQPQVYKATLCKVVLQGLGGVPGIPCTLGWTRKYTGLH